MQMPLGPKNETLAQERAAHQECYDAHVQLGEEERRPQRCWDTGLSVTQASGGLSQGSGGLSVTLPASGIPASPHGGSMRGPSRGSQAPLSGQRRRGTQLWAPSSMRSSYRLSDPTGAGSGLHDGAATAPASACLAPTWCSTACW
jgi:hypothetical protein